MKPQVPSEHVEQTLLFQWAGLAAGRYPEVALLHAVPNGGHRNKAVAGKLRAEGVKAGVPDLSLPLPTGQFGGLFIEMKRQKGGRTTKEQEEWIRALRVVGNRAVVCEGFEQAKEVVVEHIMGHRTFMEEGGFHGEQKDRRPNA